MKYNDIPKLTSMGNYQVNMSIKYAYDRIFNDWIHSKEGMSPLELEPDFQRCHVWNDFQRSKYIEYLLRGGKSGRVIYFNHPGWLTDFKGEFVLVDGLQRLTAIKKFIENEIKAFNTLYKDFDKIPHDIDILININNLQTKIEVVQWYIELNEGQIAHTKEEIEKAKNILKNLEKNGE